MFDRNARSCQLAFLVLALACLVAFQPACGTVQDIERLRQAGELGDAEAQSKLSVMYAKREGVPKDDREAVKWLRKAARPAPTPPDHAQPSRTSCY